MANNNHLAGIACPECGSLGPFHISGLAVFEVHDSGTDSFSDVEWDQESFCKCGLFCIHSRCFWRMVHMGLISPFDQRFRLYRYTGKLQ